MITVRILDPTLRPREEARQILASLTGCFEILLEWDREAKANAAKEAAASADAPTKADPVSRPG